MAMDTLVSVGVVISGILISLTHYYALDAFIGMGIALIILISTWKLLKESLYLTLDAVPEHIHLDKLEQEISQTQGVESWHHLHVWAVSTTENAATLHVVITSLNEIECTKHALKQLLSQHGITHSTIEFEPQVRNAKIQPRMLSLLNTTKRKCADRKNFQPAHFSIFL